MFTTGSKEDLITVINEAVTMGVFETSAMAKNYLLGIMEMVPSTDNIESYCKIIEEKARVRSLINAANQILDMTAVRILRRSLTLPSSLYLR